MFEKIAIVGMGCILPGAENPEQYWQILINNQDTSSILSEKQTGKDMKYYYNPKLGTPDKLCYLKNGHIRDYEFNPNGYKVAAEELMQLDDIYKWTLHAADQALKDSGYLEKGNAPEKCGLILGNLIIATLSAKKLFSPLYTKILEPYIKELLDRPDFKFGQLWEESNISPYNATTSSLPAIIAAQALGISGPNFAIDAACATTHFVLKLASYYLNTGKVDMILAGSVCKPDYVSINHGFNVLHAMPEKGDTIPFDKKSGGLKAGEGSGFIALKRYSDAIRDNDRIYAVIESIGLSNDAGAKHILVPDNDGQILAFNRAYENMPKEVDYIECHATGTPVGDQVEVNTIERFFEADKIPLIGANKGNVGHLLTASGMPAIFKVVYSMMHGVIPATIKIQDSVESANKLINSNNIVRENRPWPNTGRNKRAGINAFGFGGTNAHLILSEHIPGSSYDASVKQEEEQLAIVGMGCRFGSLTGLYEYNQSIEGGNQIFEDLPKTKWCGIDERKDVLKEYDIDADKLPKGAYVETIEFDCMKFKLPPNTVDLPLLGHLEMLNLADAACRDAGFNDKKKPRNVAVIVGAEIDFNCYRCQERLEISWQIRESLENCGITLTQEKLEKLELIAREGVYVTPYLEGITGGIGNILASRISADWKFNGPSFCLSSMENSVFKAIEIAQFLLSLDEIDAVVVGSGDFAGGLEHVLWRNKLSKLNSGEKTISFDNRVDGWDIGEGGGVIVLKRYSDAKKENSKIYSVVKSMSIVQENAFSSVKAIPKSEGVLNAVQECFAKSNLKPSDIGYMEVNASGNIDEDKAEIEGLNKAYEGTGEKTCTIGSIKANIGNTFTSSGMASIIKTSLCLNNKYLPGIPNVGELKYPELWSQSILKTQGSTMPWENIGDKKRYASINSIGMDRSYAHLILQEPEDSERKLLDKAELAQTEKKGLKKRVYTGRDRSYKEIILDEKNRKEFITAAEEDIKPQKVVAASEKDKPISKAVFEVSSLKPFVVKSGAVNIASAEEKQDVCTMEKAIETESAPILNTETYKEISNIPEYFTGNIIARNAATQLNYLKAKSGFYQRINQLLCGDFSDTCISQSSNDMPLKLVQQERMGNESIVDAEVAASTQTVARVPQIKPELVIPSVVKKKRKDVIFDEAELIEMTDGKVSNIFGKEFEEVDTYPIRTRMPSRPYMFVSRITKMTAPKGRLEPCVVEWEYDIPEDAYYVAHDKVPAMVPIESSHALIVALSYMGCDQKFKGNFSYRALEGKNTMYDNWYKPGDTLQGRVTLTKFLQAGKNVLVYYDYECFVKGAPVFKLTATSGFFTHADMANPNGLQRPKELKEIHARNKEFKPFLTCPKTRFSDSEVEAVQQGDLEKCFGSAYGKVNFPGLAAPKIRMLDRILNIDLKAGAWGLGEVLGEVDIEPDHWAFKAHFKNDPVLPGTMISQGFDQLLYFYAYYTGIHTHTHLKPTVLGGNTFSANHRGEVKCERSKLQYRITISDVEIEHNADNSVKEIRIMYYGEIIHKEKIIGVFKDLGICFK